MGKRLTFLWGRGGGRLSVNASHPLAALEDAQIVDQGLGGVGALGGGRMYNIITGTRHRHRLTTECSPLSQAAVGGGS